MNAEYGDRLRQAFDRALDVPEEERAVFVRSEYGGDEQLCQELLGMLGHVGASDSFLQPLESEAMRDLFGSAGRARKRKASPLPDLEGREFAERYRFEEKLGEGGSGVVYAGVDRLTDKAIAIKVLRQAREGARQNLRREAAALRLLRLPGIVQLLDEGIQDDLVYLVTELVDGAPFPGREDALAWDELADVTTAFLETVDRMHRAGIVHGDLKPGNVLVRQDGVPVILDLGIAQGPRAAAADGKRRGTFRYVAPEQLREGAATPRADLYAIGVMLYEALTGAAYRSDPTVALTRLGVVTDRPSKSLDDVEVDVPDHVRAVVNRLLANDPEDRPESARDVLAALAPTAAGVPGREDVLEPLLGAVAPGETFDVDALRALFAGGDRLHHIPEDAARELWRRTGGQPGRVVPELDAWSRAGLGYWDAGRYHLRRLEIDQLQRSARAFALRPAPPAPDEALTATQRRLLFAVELAGPRAEVPLLASALETPRAEIEQLLEELMALGIVERGPDGVWEALSLPSSATKLHASLAPDLHARLARALPLGDERRLMHTVAAGRHEEVPRESIEAARALYREGDAEGARTAIAEGLGALQLHPDTEATHRLLELQVRTALMMGTKPALDEALHRLGCYPSDEVLDRLERLTRAVLHALDGQPQRAIEELPSLEGVTEEDECSRILSARLFMARFLGEEALEGEIQHAQRVAEDIGSTVISAAAASAKAWLLYRQERHREAADLHLEAARGAPNAATRVSSLLSAASAYLDAGELDRALDLAAKARGFACEKRHAVLEARAEYVARAAAYRRGDRLDPDLPLAVACRDLGDPHVAALIDLNEAAVAWRRDRFSLARQLAGDAARIWKGDQARWHRLLARALQAASGSSTSSDERRRLVEESRQCPDPKVALQAGWLLGRAHPDLADEAREVVTTMIDRIPEAQRAIPLEIVSIPEAMQ